MRKLTTTAFAVLGLGLAMSALAAGRVEVKFIEPAQFADAGRGELEIERTTQALGEHFKSLAGKLPDGQTLAIEVTAIDLAGELRPTRRGDEIRVLRGRADWPRMELKYALTQGGQTLKAGQARLEDMSYQQSSLGVHQGREFAYERRMIDRWFTESIAAPGAARK